MNFVVVFAAAIANVKSCVDQKALQILTFCKRIA